MAFYFTRGVKFFTSPVKNKTNCTDVWQKEMHGL